MSINHPNERKPDLESAVLSSAVTRWVVILIGLAMFCPGFGICLGAETAVLKEQELKAGFIYNFTKYVEWPTSSLVDTNAPFVVAVAGSSPCTAELEKIAKDRKIKGRDLIIKTLTKADGGRDAHVLFIPASENARLKDWLAAVRGRGVLTIGETDEFGKQGGIINFLSDGDKIRFDLNIEQADAVGLKVSAQLQKLARTVRKKS